MAPASRSPKAAFHEFEPRSAARTLAPINQALSQIAFRPAADFFGIQVIQIRANDLGSSGPGGPQTGVRDVEIDIAGINDPPGFQSLSGVVLTVDEDANAAATSFPGFLKEIRVGPTNESSRQLILLQVVAEQPSLFSVQPSIDTANGRLRFTVATNVSGETWVTVQAVDTGVSPMAESIGVPSTVFCCGWRL